ncbi:MAG: hypothetical protein ACYC0C_11485 [Devosia sp.]
MVRRILAAAVLAFVATPALADPNCLGGGSSGLHFSYGVRIGDDFTEAEQMQFDKMRLRQQGIDADTAERTWLGCLKVTSRDANGSWTTDYYDPDTFEQKPLNLKLP